MPQRGAAGQEGESDEVTDAQAANRCPKFDVVNTLLETHFLDVFDFCRVLHAGSFCPARLEAWHGRERNRAPFGPCSSYSGNEVGPGGRLSRAIQIAQERRPTEGTRSLGSYSRVMFGVE